MKKLFLILTVLVSLVLTNCSSSDGGSEPEPNITFYETYEDCIPSSVIIQTTDNGYAMIYADDSFVDLFKIAKFDKNGELEWDNDFSEIVLWPSSDVDIVSLDDGNIGLIIVRNHSDEDNVELISLDLSGNVVSEKTMTVEEEIYEWEKVTKTPDGGFLLTYYYLDIFYALKLSSTLDKEWQRAFDREVSYLCSDGNLLGFIGVSDTEFDIYKYTTDNTLVWSTTITGEERFSMFRYPVLNSDGSITIFVNEGYEGGWPTNCDSRVITLGENGNILLDKKLTENYGGGSYGIRTNDSGYLVSYIENPLTNLPELVKFDSNGNKEWGKNITFLQNIEITKDNGAVIYGQNSSKIYILKLDQDYNLNGDWPF